MGGGGCKPVVASLSGNFENLEGCHCERSVAIYRTKSGFKLGTKLMLLFRFPQNLFRTKFSNNEITTFTSLTRIDMDILEGTSKQHNINQLFNKKSFAYTLAEVLITLGIIGVVAMFVMPVLLTEVTERVNSNRQANIAQKVTKAVELMIVNGDYERFSTTEEFVNKLKKYLKVVKVCYSDALLSCWPTKTVTRSDGSKYNVADAKIGKDIGILNSTNNVGLILNDGAFIILTYNPSEAIPHADSGFTSSSKSLPIGGGKTKNFAYTSNATNAIDFVMDVNGGHGPNAEPDEQGNYYDIRSFKLAKFSEIPWENGIVGKILYLEKPGTTVDCRSSNSSSKDYQTYCGPHPSGFEYDYWAGAKKACSEQTHGKGALPNVSKLKEIYNYKGNYSSVDYNSEWFWSSDETSGYTDGGSLVNLINGNVKSYNYKYDSKLYVLCVAN